MQLLAKGKSKRSKKKELDSRRGSLVMQIEKLTNEEDTKSLKEVETSPSVVEEGKNEDTAVAEPSEKKRMSAREAGLLGIDTLEDPLFEGVMGISITGRDSVIGSRRTSEEGLLEEEGTAVDATSNERLREADPYNDPFTSKYKPDEMRCLGLIAHNHMKPAMKDFVLSHKEVLKKFRLTGTNTTMTMLKSVFGDDPSVRFGPTCQSGPLGGDAELCALMCLEDLGGMIFFQDPLSAHPHQADIDSLNRLGNVHNILTAPNPASAHAICFVLKCSLEQGRKDKIPSFFYSLQSPGVKVYKEEQRRQVERNK